MTLGLLFAWKLVYCHGHTRKDGLAIGAGFGFRWQNYNGLWGSMPYPTKNNFEFWILGEAVAVGI